MNFAHRYAEMVGRLAAHPDVTVLWDHRAAPADEATLAAVERELGWALPPAARALWGAWNGLCLVWGRRDEVPPGIADPGGRVLEGYYHVEDLPFDKRCLVYIPSLQEVFFGEGYTHETIDPEETLEAYGQVLTYAELYRRFRPFDILGYFEFGFLMPPPGEAPAGDLDVILADDYAASLDESRVASLAWYLELLLATHGHVLARVEEMSFFPGGQPDRVGPATPAADLPGRFSLDALLEDRP